VTHLWYNYNLQLERPTEVHPDTFGKCVGLYLVFTFPYALFSRLILTVCRLHSEFPTVLISWTL